MTKESKEMEDFFKKSLKYLGLDDTAVRLLAYYKSEPALESNLDFINELIRRMPDYIYQKYCELTEKRKDNEPANSHSKTAGEIANIIEHMLTYNNEASRSECINYAMAHRIFPCTRERMKRISEGLVKKR